MSSKSRNKVLVVAALATALFQVGAVSQASASTGDARLTVNRLLAVDGDQQRQKAPLIRVAPGTGGCGTCDEPWWDRNAIGAAPVPAAT